MIRIYMIEDTKDDFLDITKAIYKSMGIEAVSVLPKEDTKDNNKYNNWGIITDDILKSLSTTPLEVPERLYNDLQKMDIDYFIIDNCLQNPSANDGKEILKLFAAKGIAKNRLILYSGDSIPPVLPNEYIVLHKEPGHVPLINYLLKDTNSKPVNKFWYKVASTTSKVRSLLGAGIVTTLKIMTIVAFVVGVCCTCYSGWHLYKNDLVSSSESSTSQIKNLSDSANDPEFKKFQRDHNFQFSVLKAEGDLGYQVTVTDTVSKTKATLLMPISNTSKHNVIVLLEFIEGIFLNFLPFFILFGFLSYCSSYLVFVWASANPAKLDAQRATKILKFSKALFISSIIATVIINLLEGLVKKESLINLVPHFILIMILCIYYLALEKTETGE